MEIILIQEAVERIKLMEDAFDQLQKAEAQDAAMLFEDASLKKLLQVLKQYYEGGEWLKDYELDEKGLLPQELKRGVLAQDEVYNFLERIENFNSD